MNYGKAERLEHWPHRITQEKSINKTAPDLHGGYGIEYASPSPSGDTVLRTQRGLRPRDEGNDITRQTGDVSLYGMQL